MTQEIGWVSLGIVPTLDRGFDSKLSRGLDPALARVGQSSGKRFGGILGKAAVAGAAGIIGAGFAAFRFAGDALAEAREAQEIGATTDAILKSTAHSAKLTRKEYDGLTKSLMEKTAIDDEQIAQGGNLLLTFKNVKREGKGLKDVFGRALAASLDLTAAGFGSIESTSKQLGKALNDPVKGMSALGRAGVTFTADQQETIKSLVETGDLLGAQKIILKEVESQVGGTAEAQKTSAKELEVAWGNLKEEIGDGLIPIVEDLADFMLGKGIPAGEKFSDWLRKDGIPQAKDLAKKLEPLAHELLPAVADAFGTVKDIAKDALPIIEDIVGAFNDMPDWAKKAIVAGGLGAVVAKKTGLLGGLTGGPGGGSGLLGLVSKAKPLPVFVVNGGGLGGLGGELPGGKGTKGTGPASKFPLLLPLLPALGAVGTGIPDKPEGGIKSEAEFWEAVGRVNVKTSSLFEPVLNQIDELSKGKVALDTSEAEVKLRRLREDAARPIEVPIVAALTNSISDLFASAFGGGDDGAGDLLAGPLGPKQRRNRGTTINIDKMVAHDYRDFQRQAQNRAQQAAVGAVGGLAS